MGNGRSQWNGYAPVRCADLSETPKARYLRLTFPEPGRYVLAIGPGDHTAQRWELSIEQLRELILDAIPKVVAS